MDDPAKVKKGKREQLRGELSLVKTLVLVLEGFYFMFKYSSQSKADLVVSIRFRQ